MKSPCYHCPNRSPACHGKCEPYQEYAAYCEQIRQKKMIEHDIKSARIIAAIRKKDERRKKNRK